MFAEHLNPGPEPTNKQTFDWALWRGQMALLDTIPADDTIIRNHLEAVHWLGEVRAQHGGDDPGEPDAWPCPNGSLIGSLDIWCTLFGDWMKPMFPAGDRQLAIALWRAHHAILRLVGNGRGTESDIAACRRLHRLTHAKIEGDADFRLRYTEMPNDPTWTTTMEVWIRG